MRLYLDDDSASPLLARRLREAGNDVLMPADNQTVGARDPVHLTQAIRTDRVLLTGNHDDFELLHDLVLQARGHHPGILVVRRENNPRRDLSFRGIVACLTRLV